MGERGDVRNVWEKKVCANQVVRHQLLAEMRAMSKRQNCRSLLLGQNECTLGWE